MRRTSTLTAMLLAAAVLAGGATQLALPGAAGAAHRAVTVNGILLGPQELALADRAAGFALPDGNYWYDASSGLWGVRGGPALGRVAPAPQQQGWSWRNDATGEGMIYNPDGASWQDRVWVSPR
jgi:hypothetical protein